MNRELKLTPLWMLFRWHLVLRVRRYRLTQILVQIRILRRRVAWFLQTEIQMAGINPTPPILAVRRTHLTGMLGHRLYLPSSHGMTPDMVLIPHLSILGHLYINIIPATYTFSILINPNVPIPC